MWFPRPTTSADLEIPRPGGGLSSAELFDLLHQPDAQEWKDKVGVVTPADGSAKPTTRLLKSGDWVFKTDVGQQTPDKAALQAQVQRFMELARRIDLWHPHKFWFLLHTAEEQWLPVSACPQLTTIRYLPVWEHRISWWSRMIVIGVKMSLEHGIGLDLNPSNFAFKDPYADQLYYLDDEYYSQHSFFEIAEAVVARIPEEPATPAEKWQEWGQQLRRVLEPFAQPPENWYHFLDGIREYPLIAAFETQRKALLQGLAGANVPVTATSLGLDKQAPNAAQIGRSQPIVQATTTDRRITAPPPLPLLRDMRETQAASAASAAIIPEAPALRNNAQQYALTCVFADVHANLPALETVLRETHELGVDSYLFLGDVVSYGPFPRQCIARLAELKHLTLLRGNHDNTAGIGVPENGSNRIAQIMDMWTYQQLSPAEREWLLTLPIEYIETDWLAVHGAPLDPQRFYAYVYELTYKDNFDWLAQQQKTLCFYGHTHAQFVYHRPADGVDRKAAVSEVEVFQPQESFLMNPGSVGQPRDGDPRAAFALWHRAANHISFHRILYPVDVTINAVKQEGLPEDLMYRLEVGR